MREWLWYAIGAAVLYGLHQIFTKLASAGISDGYGGAIVETTAAVTIGLYVIAVKALGGPPQHATRSGVLYSVATGICVGAGTVLFFLLFQRGGPLSAVPAILAVGAAIMAVAGVAWFREPLSWSRGIGVVLSIASILLLRKS